MGQSSPFTAAYFAAVLVAKANLSSIEEAVALANVFLSQ